MNAKAGLWTRYSQASGLSSGKHCDRSAQIGANIEEALNPDLAARLVRAIRALEGLDDVFQILMVP